MLEWLAAVKIKSLVGEGVKSLASTSLKSAGTEISNVVRENLGLSKTGDPFGEHGPIADAIRPLSLNTEESQRLTAYLNSELFGSLIRASPSFAITGKGNHQRALIQLYLEDILPQRPHELLSHLAEEIVIRLSEASALALEEAHSLGLIFANDAAAASAHSVVAGEVFSVITQIAEANPYSLSQLKSYEIFEASYRRQVGRQYAKLRPEALGDTKPVAIDELYVASDLKPLLGSDSGSTVTREKLLKSSFRTVILGNPGGGKSTFVKKLCHELSTRHEEALYGDRRLTPVVIILREYAQYRKTNPCSIVDYATLQAKANFQLDHVPDGALRYLFITGRAVVIFDGLDELIEIADRLDITQAVERFVDQYQAVPILITSREVGYEQAPLDSDKFKVYKLQSFTEEQTSDYASKWFKVNREGSLDQAEARSRAFMRDSAVVPDLRENPLMLSLLCNLYKQDRHLPANRPEVYKRCADLLFYTWDRFRNISVSLPIERKLRPAMNHLAHWIYADKNLQAGVAEDKIVEETSQYLSKWCPDPDDAVGIATQFVTFFRGRAWVFSDVGSNKKHPLYGFTHTTFLEFFTSDYLVKNHDTAKALAAYLRPRLLNREWDVVCQLCYQMYADLRSAADELTDDLVVQINRRRLLERLKLASFLARSLDLIFPARESRIAAVQVCMKSFIEAVVELSADRVKGKRSEISSLANEIWQAVITCDRDMLDVNARTVVEEFCVYINSQANSSDAAAALVAFDLLSFSSNQTLQQDSAHSLVWGEAAREVLERTKEVRRSLFDVSRYLTQSSWWQEKISITEAVKHHGINALISPTPTPLASWQRSDIATQYVGEALGAGFGSRRLKPQDMDELHEIIAGCEIPERERDGPLHVAGWTSDTFVWPGERSRREIVLYLLLAREYYLGGQIGQDIRTLEVARGNQEFSTDADRVIDALDLSNQMSDLLRAWLGREELPKRET